MAIASCLIDTNILLRIFRPADPHHKAINVALSKLLADGAMLCFTLQNVAEFWNVMTRPIGRNGFGHSTIEAERELRNIETGMNLLPNSTQEYWEWRRIVVQYAVSGVQVHDARLVAAMRTHGISHLLSRPALSRRNVSSLYARCRRFPAVS